MVDTSVFHHDFAPCERIIKKLNRSFAWTDNFIGKVEILLVRFSILGIQFRLNTKAKICPGLFVLLDKHFCASALSLDLNQGSESVFNPPTSVETFFVFRSGVKLRRLRIKIPKMSRVSDSLTFI